MRPASARFPDGPQNLRDALAVAQDERAIGVSVVAAGKVHAAVHVHKVHPYQLDAFDSFEQGVIACVEEGRVRWLPAAQAWRLDGSIPLVSGLNWNDWLFPLNWPRVEWITSHADGDADIIDALLTHTSSRRLRGLIIAGTGNGTLHQALLPALVRAHDAGVLVWRTTRCIGRSVVEGTQAVWPPSVQWSPSKARIALMLTCMQSDTKKAT
jgi:L-asparaginase